MKQLFNFFALAIVLMSAMVINGQVLVSGNPTCEDIGFNRGFKIDPPTSDTFTVNGVGSITTVINNEVLNFSTTSPAFVGAVIVKGGDAANVYYYSPETLGANGLVAPVNSSGNNAALSHIDFCYNLSPTSTKVSVSGRVTASNSRIIRGKFMRLFETLTGRCCGKSAT